MADFDSSSRTLSNESVHSEESFFSDEDLTPEQMNELLQQAAQRLKAGQLARTPSTTVKIPKLQHATLPAPYVKTVGRIARAESKAFVPDSDRSALEKPRTIVDPVTAKQSRIKAKETLSDWYNLPRTDLTPEFKRDLQLLNMRSVLDPHRMYKKAGKFKVPEYSQMGVLVEGPTEFFSGRIQKKDRKKTFVEDALATEAKTGRFKMKYGEVQMSKMSGKKAFYKALKAKRKSGVKG
ncbi:rRNA processing protein Fcf2 [Tothia fuscella]|uniref:rRNA processing protein Fcf2 n=1 Tax=Tothia fuscella TaxID=1048955 RepID=A0A9P4NQK6_9PEZI|nr:rRNA processing protein Fcf2 [Tothia fuscella]